MRDKKVQLDLVQHVRKDNIKIKMSLLATVVKTVVVGNIRIKPDKVAAKAVVLGNMLAVLVTQVVHLVVLDNIKIVDLQAVAIIVHLANIAVVVEIADVVYAEKANIKIVKVKLVVKTVVPARTERPAPFDD